ncbi:MAG: hypothetical protein RBT65_00065 [Methanolobus sp.]|jgi:hypothetical protein|nr:hypothetical protein [Methanolobus sp.]
MYEIIYKVLVNPLTWGAIIGISIYDMIYSRKKGLSFIQSLPVTLFFLACAFAGILIATYISQ